MWLPVHRTLAISALVTEGSNLATTQDLPAKCPSFRVSSLYLVGPLVFQARVSKCSSQDWPPKWLEIRMALFRARLLPKACRVLTRNCSGNRALQSPQPQAERTN